MAHTGQEESGNTDEESLKQNPMDPRNSQGLEGRKTCQGYNSSGKGGSEVARLVKAMRKVSRGLRPLSQPLTFSPRFHGGGWACPASVCVPGEGRALPARTPGGHRDSGPHSERTPELLWKGLPWEGRTFDLQSRPRPPCPHAAR